MLKADMYMGRVGVGVTSPSLIKADDGYIYVVKMKNNRLGTKVLVNEYIAAWMGKKLNLPFPFSDCIESVSYTHLDVYKRQECSNEGVRSVAVINVGDLVVRKSHDKDIIFKVIDINRDENDKDKCVLKGMHMRLVADAPIHDLEQISAENLRNEVVNMEKMCIRDRANQRIK